MDEKGKGGGMREKEGERKRRRRKKNYEVIRLDDRFFLEIGVKVVQGRRHS